MDNPENLWNNSGWFVPNARKLNHFCDVENMEQLIYYHLNMA